tara:strand:- start:2412 stop:3290 length:879 start_codon:yes stop_codon:yes gene_type:complete
MALKFGLSNTFMGPQQAAKFGESFGESIGGLGLALGDAWKAYQEKQDKEASIVDPATGRVPLTFEAEDTYDEFSEFDDTIDDPSFDDVNLGEDFGKTPLGPLAKKGQALFESGEMDITPLAIRTVEGPSLMDYTLDRKSLGGKINIPDQSTVTQEDIDTYEAQGGNYDALVEKKLRMGDSSITGGGEFGYNRQALTKFGGSAVPNFQATMDDLPNYSGMIAASGDKFFRQNTGTGEWNVSSQSPLEALSQMARSGELEEQYGSSLSALGKDADQYARNLGSGPMFAGYNKFK